MNKKDKILIVVTSILMIVLIGSYIWDINKFVLKRTMDIEVTEEMNVISMKKYGLLFYRKAYEARIQLPRENAEAKLTDIAAKYGMAPEVYSYEDYQTFAAQTFKSEILKPEPQVGTEVAVLKTFNADGDYITYMMDVENDTDAFIYVYYSRN